MNLARTGNTQYPAGVCLQTTQRFKVLVRHAFTTLASVLVVNSDLPPVAINME
jgi:hypothetical protein